MPVTITWDEDAPLTGQPDAGSASKVYAAAGAGTVTVTDEAVGGPSRTLNYTVPLDLTAVEADPATVDSAGDAAARTTTVAGSGFPASASGTIAVATGAPGAYGTTVVSTGATTNASGVFTGAALTVPSGQAAGDYHIEATFGDIADLQTALTVTSTSLEAPTGLASPAQTANTVDLTWNAVTGATGYVVRWKLTAGEEWTTEAPVTDPSGTVAGLTADTAYDFQVMATADGAQSPWSTTLPQSTGPAQTQLGAPTNVANDPTTATTVPLTWDSGDANTQTYTVQWRTSPDGVWNPVPDIATTNHTVTDLDAETAYDFQVKAVAEGFTDSTWAPDPPLTATTQALPVLTAPTGVASPAQTATTVDLTWTAVADAENYTVRWAPTGTTTWTENPQVATNADTVAGLTTGTTYDFQVMASATGFTDSPWSATFTQATS